MKRSIFIAATLALVFLTLAPIFVPSGAVANFMSDDQREDSKTFPKFFMKRFDTWLNQDFLAGKSLLTPLQREYANLFIETSTRFGEKRPEGFIRDFDFVVTLRDGKHLNGPYRFFDTEQRLAVRAKAIEILKKQAPKFDLQILEGKTIGLGFARPGADLEVLIWENDLRTSALIKSLTSITQDQLKERTSGRLALALKDSKMIDLEVLQTAVQTKAHCPPVLKSSQVDRLLSADGSERFIWHVSQYEEQALDPKGRIVADRFRSKLNLPPGTIEWKSTKDYRFSYP